MLHEENTPHDIAMELIAQKIEPRNTHLLKTLQEKLSKGDYREVEELVTAREGAVLRAALDVGVQIGRDPSIVAFEQ